MRTTKTFLIAAIVVAAVLAAGLTPIYARPEADESTAEPFFNRAQQLERLRETLRSRLHVGEGGGWAGSAAEINVDDLDEADADSMISSVEDAEATDETVGPVWLVHARGFSWSIDETSDSNESAPVGVYLAIRKVKTTEAGTLYEVVRGVVGHEGERVKVEGKAVLLGEGVFALRLQGEDLELKAVGRVARARIGVRLAMRGSLVHDGEDYGFKMTGRAVPMRPMWAWRRGAATDEAQPEPSAAQSRVAKGVTA